MGIDILVPELGESVVEATVGQWLKKAGEAVSVGETLVELETDKVNLEVSAAQSGTLASIAAQEGQDVSIGDVLGVIEEGDVAHTAPESTIPEVAATEPAAQNAESDASEDEKITPVARRMAEQEGVNLGAVHGSGAGGRVTRHDVEEAIDTQSSETGELPPVAPPISDEKPAPQKTSGPDDREEVIRMTRRRRTIAERLVDAQHT
ncbi:MAG: dihydrolipoyllysine-residue succinyltransferase, partial [Candidatus Latescibacteria bacterium]|nr:dihydrolipoyllysine-residue succinyltransferase [Candidatus Latescibacterota bacterium]